MVGSKEFIEKCKFEITCYHNNKVDTLKGENDFIHSEDVYLVWYAKELQNHKALLSTILQDGMYYECTYNGDKKEMYLDAYKKQENVVIKDEE